MVMMVVAIDEGGEASWSLLAASGGAERRENEKERGSVKKKREKERHWIVGFILGLGFRVIIVWSTGGFKSSFKGF